jgi:adenine-specific DNA-methyltransferase
MHLYETLEQQLKKEPNYVTDDGELKKWVVLNKAQNYDEELIELLVQNDVLKEKFFVKVKDVLVFKQNLFLDFLEQKNYLNDSYTRYKNKIGLTIDGKFLKQRNEVALVWPFKDCILEGGQSREEQKREEIFFNEILAQDEITQLLEPKVLTNAKRIDKDGEKELDQFNRNEYGTITDNLIIKGNNLLALHSLKKEFAGKVKLIYIDPPYNTGNDSFKYNDSFNHSSWLTFMKNRLDIAKELLRTDGFILIQIDNNEAAYLKVLCDEIFVRSNYRNSIIVKKGTKSLQKQFTDIQKLNAGFDTILLYTKSEGVKLPNLFKELKGATTASWNNHWRGTDRPTMRYELFGIDPESGQWRWEKKRTEVAVSNYEKLCEYIRINEGANTEITDELVNTYYEQYLNENDIVEHSDFELVRLNKNKKPEHYIPPRMKVLLSENWMDLSVAGRVTKFEHEKNEDILRRIIEWLTIKGETVLDFFTGSGSTVAVAHKLERHYIGVEQMDYGKEDAIHRLQSVIKGDNKGISEDVNWQGGGSFVYLELKKFNETFMEQIEEAKSTETLLQIWKQLKAKSFFKYSIDLQAFENSLDEFKQFDLKRQKEILCEILDKNQLYVNLSSLNDADFACTEEEKRLNQDFYRINHD